MTEQTDQDDGHRPLTPEERKALRRLIEKEDDIIEVAQNFAHLGWFAQFVLKLAKWSAAVIGAVVLWNSYKAGNGFK